MVNIRFPKRRPAQALALSGRIGPPWGRDRGPRFALSQRGGAPMIQILGKCRNFKFDEKTL